MTIRHASTISRSTQVGKKGLYEAQRCQRIHFECASRAVEVHVEGGLALWTDNPSIVNEKIDRPAPENGRDTVECLFVGDGDDF